MSFISPSRICKYGSRLGEVRLKVLGDLGERSGKGGRVSAGFRVVWEGGLAGFGLGGVFKEGHKRTFPGLLSCLERVSTICVFVFYRVVYHCFIVFLLFPELLRSSEIMLLSFPEWSGFRRSCLIIPRRVEDLGIIPISLPEQSRIRDIEHTGGKDIWPDLVHHKQHNICDSRIRRFGGSRSKIVNVG